MATEVIKYDVLISCPSDVRNEIEVIKKVIDDINRHKGEDLNLILRVKHWSTDVLMKHGKPQQTINEQIVESSDVVVAVFNNKPGTPTDKFPSGTIEEISIMIDNGKQVFLCFSNKPINRNEFNADDFQKIEDFKKRYAKEGLYLLYDSDQDLYDKLYNQFSLLLIALFKKDTGPKIPIKNDVHGDPNSKLINSIRKNIELKNQIKNDGRTVAQSNNNGDNIVADTIVNGDQIIIMGKT